MSETDPKLEMQLDRAFRSGKGEGANILSIKFMEQALFYFTSGDDEKANIYREVAKDCRYWEDQFKTPPKSEDAAET